MAARTYRLIVERELSDRLTFALERITIAGSQGDTTPTGQIRDHAELQGIMQPGRMRSDRRRRSMALGGGAVGVADESIAVA